MIQDHDGLYSLKGGKSGSGYPCENDSQYRTYGLNDRSHKLPFPDDCLHHVAGYSQNYGLLARLFLDHHGRHRNAMGRVIHRHDNHDK